MNDMLLAMYKTSDSVTDCSSEDPILLSSLHSPAHVQDTSSSMSHPQDSDGPAVSMSIPCGQVATINADTENQVADMTTQDIVISDDSKLIWQAITAAPECVPTAMTTPTRSIISPNLPSSLKKVTFSTPEVTEQHRFEVHEEERGTAGGHAKAKKLKKRHRHHAHGEEDKEVVGEDGAKVKRRRKTKEGSGASDLAERRNNTGEGISNSPGYAPLRSRLAL